MALWMYANIALRIQPAFGRLKAKHLYVHKNYSVNQYLFCARPYQSKPKKWKEETPLKKAESKWNNNDWENETGAVWPSERDSSIIAAHYMTFPKYGVSAQTFSLFFLSFLFFVVCEMDQNYRTAPPVPALYHLDRQQFWHRAENGSRRWVVEGENNTWIVAVLPFIPIS